MSRAGGGAASPPRAPWRAADYFDLSLISVTHGLSDGFTNMLVPVLALIVADLRLSAVQAGALLSAFSLSNFLLQYPISLVADATGRKKTILLSGMSVSAAAFLLMGWAGSFEFLLLLSFLAGAGNTVFHPCGTALTAERFAARRAFAISYESLGGNVGTGLMPLAQAALAAVSGWRTAVVSCALPAALLLPLMGLRFSERPRGAARGAGGRGREAWDLTRRLLRNRHVPMLALVYALRGMGTKGMMGFLPLLATQKLGMTTESIGLAVSLYFGAGMVAKPLMGFLYDRWGARSALSVPLLLTGCFALAMPFVNWPAGILALAAMTGLVSFVSPIILTAAADLCEEELLASSVGFIYTCNGLNFIAPLVGGWLAERFGLESSYAFFALAVWMGLGASTRLPGRRS